MIEKRREGYIFVLCILFYFTMETNAKDIRFIGDITVSTNTTQPLTAPRFIQRGNDLTLYTGTLGGELQILDITTSLSSYSFKQLPLFLDNIIPTFTFGLVQSNNRTLLWYVGKDEITKDLLLAQVEIDPTFISESTIGFNNRRNV